jgi:hypothetical protein
MGRRAENIAEVSTVSVTAFFIITPGDVYYVV